MSDGLTIALAQFNPRVGDVPGNIERLRALRSQAAQAGADLVVASELCITGYPPEDLVLKRAFLDTAMQGVRDLAAETGDGGPGLIVGCPWLEDTDARHPLRGKVYNAALLLDGGEVQARRYKWNLPNYGVFDEVRVFAQGPLPGPMNFRGVRLGVMLCEDLWTEDVSECLEESGAEILVVSNGSPYERDKHDLRTQVAVRRITESGLPLIYVNQVGGQDELVFDGASFVLGADCSLAAQLPAFEEHLGLTYWRRGAEGWQCEDSERVPVDAGLGSVYRALVLGLRDYVGKNGFPGVIVGLSGGIDSALSAAVAVDALGAKATRCVMMPSPYTSQHSLDDAAECARLLGADLDEVGIQPAMDAFADMLAPIFTGHEADTTEENIQARSRGIILMAISNKLGHMVLSTGNKSEMSVGYATLYGDMAGGFNVLKDVYKTTVYALARWRNQAEGANGVAGDGLLGPAGRVIPERILTKAPSAELKPDQTDQDSLPSYDELDDILECLIEEEMGTSEIVARGHEEEVVRRVWRMLENAEYKRRQAAPGVKITRRAFGRDRRYPITNAFKGQY
ncbi:MAG: NAD+ synthase [Rhodovibrionaceae bacterium]|nr:NAD+ synthase [Rhodovibrionaceae bacterium]